MKSNIEAVDLPFFRLSESQDLILFLIKKELQGTKLTMELDRIGFDTSVYGSDLGVGLVPQGNGVICRESGPAKSGQCRRARAGCLSGIKKQTESWWL